MTYYYLKESLKLLSRLVCARDGARRVATHSHQKKRRMLLARPDD